MHGAAPPRLRRRGGADATCPAARVRDGDGVSGVALARWWKSPVRGEGRGVSD